MNCYGINQFCLVSTLLLNLQSAILINHLYPRKRNFSFYCFSSLSKRKKTQKETKKEWIKEGRMEEEREGGKGKEKEWKNVRAGKKSLDIDWKKKEPDRFWVASQTRKNIMEILKSGSKLSLLIMTIAPHGLSKFTTLGSNDYISHNQMGATWGQPLWGADTPSLYTQLQVVWIA